MRMKVSMMSKSNRIYKHAKGLMKKFKEGTKGSEPKSTMKWTTYFRKMRESMRLGYTRDRENFC